MQKTVREWGEELLPEPYKSQFMENLDNEECNPNPKYKSEKTFFLSNAFDWELTPDSQGWHYWDAVDDWVDGFGKLPEQKLSERQTAEALLKEFGEWWNAGNKEPQDTVITEGAVNDFLTSKYGKG